MTLFTKPTILLTAAALTFAYTQGKDLKHQWPQIGTVSAFAASANSSSYALTFNTVTDEPIQLVEPEQDQERGLTIAANSIQCCLANRPSSSIRLQDFAIGY
jgi:hypothetical protein